jgi:hypothetical protein
VNLAAEGKRYDPVPFTLGADRVRAFRDLFGGGGGIPPTVLTAAEFSVFPTIVGDPELALDFTRVVHGSQEYLFARPLAEGESFTVHARIESIRQRGGTGFLTIAMDLVGGDGDVAATARSTMIERGAGA